MRCPDPRAACLRRPQLCVLQATLGDPADASIEPLAFERGADEEEDESLGWCVELGAETSSRVRVPLESVHLHPVGEHLDPVGGNAMPVFEVAFHRRGGTDAIGRRRTLEEVLLNVLHDRGLGPGDRGQPPSCDPGIRLYEREVVLDFGRTNGVHRYQVGVVRGEAFHVDDVELLAALRQQLRRPSGEARALERIAEPVPSSSRRLDGEEAQIGVRLHAGRGRGDDGHVLVQCEPFRVPEEKCLNRPCAIEAPVDRSDAQGSHLVPHCRIGLPPNSGYR
jgi:hypothetical protein